MSRMLPRITHIFLTGVLCVSGGASFGAPVATTSSDTDIPASLQPAQIDYTVVAPPKARPINVFSLDGNLYVQFPENVRVTRVQAPGSTKKSPRLPFQIEWPYLVVQNGENGAAIHTNKGVVKVSARQQTVVAHYSPPASLPDSLLRPPPSRNNAQARRVDAALSKMDRDVDRLLAKATRHHSDSAPILAHPPKYFWPFDGGSLRLTLSRHLTKLGYKMQWRPSIDFQVAHTTIRGDDVADLLRPLASQYGLPISLCRNTRQVIVHSYGTTPGAADCANKTVSRN